MGVICGSGRDDPDRKGPLPVRQVDYGKMGATGYASAWPNALA
jgi:hypothetical protein